MEQLTLGFALVCFLSLCFSVTKAEPPKIYYMHVQSEIKYRFATTLVTSKVANAENTSSEATFDVTLPNEAFISKFKLITNNKVYDGVVKEKEKAKEEYAKAKESGQSAGHIVAKPRQTNKFQIMVNVAAQEKVVFELTYQELLKRSTGRYSHVIHIDPGQVVDDMSIEVTINESQNITLLRVPPLRDDKLRKENPDASNKLAVIERPTPKSAYILYQPTRSQQDKGISGQFVVEYDIERNNNAGEVLVVNGYFVHFYAPDEMTPMPMDIVFILDKSGSMSGRKIVQLRRAMKNILKDLRNEDRFNIMPFDGLVKMWRPELVSVSTTSIKEANDYVDRVRATGSTNINDALLQGIELLSQIESSRAPVIIFLTDGQPTTGESNIDNILSNVRRKNEAVIPIFSLAFGTGADYQFTKKLAAQNNGLGRKIFEDSDADLQITGFYDEISTVLLKNVTFKYLDGAVNETSLTKTDFNTVFNGTEIIICGELLAGNNMIEGIITGTSRNMPKVSLNLPSTNTIIYDDKPRDKQLNLTTAGDFAHMTEKMWAYMTIKQLLREKDAVIEEQEIVGLDERIVKLALKYQFVTPLTSMVVTMPDIVKPSKPSRERFDMEEMAGFSGLGRQVYNSPSLQLHSSFFNSPPPPQSVGLSLPVNTHRLRNPHSRTTSARGYRPVNTRRLLYPLPKTPVFKDYHARPRDPLPRTTVSTVGRKSKRKNKMSKQQKKHVKQKKQKMPKLPNLLVKIPGITIPFCLKLDAESGQAYTLLHSSNTEQTIVIEASTVKGGSRKSNIPLAAAVYSNYTIQNRIVTDLSRQNSAPLLTMDHQNLIAEIHQSQNDPKDLKIYVTFPTGGVTDLSGIIELFNGMKGKLVKTKSRKGRVVAKIKVRKSSLKTKFRAIEVNDPLPGTSSCWFLNKSAMKRLNIDVSQYIRTTP